MAFDFPSAPAVGDKYESLGVTYSWNGTAWDLGTAEGADDKVSKAGDTMTGELGMTGVPIRYTDNSYPTANASEKVITCDNKGYPGWNKGSLRYSSNGATEGWLELWGGGGGGDVKVLSAKPGGIDVYKPLKMKDGAGIHWENTAAQASSLDFSEGICMYGFSAANSKFGWTITSGTLNHVVENIGNRHCFRVGPDDATNTRAIIDQNGLGPRNSYNVTFQNSFTGTMDFRVNPAMVTMRILNVKTANAQTGVTQHVKICDYPAGVPAPWGNLYVHVEGCSDTSFAFLGRHAMVSAQTGGVFLSMYGGSTPEDFPANTYFSCTITWSR